VRANPFEAYFAAVVAERSAWETVRDRPPGTPAFCAEAWAAWRAAVTRADDARRAMMQAIARRPFSA
jgi:hypothetical protein